MKELGATGRGEHMEIGTYVEHSMVSELSGNIIDLCPVGALTSKPFRYRARAWEMQSHPSVALHDAVGSNIEFHVRQNEVMRVVPRDNESLNESWISDRDRFSYLGLNHPDRIVKPMVRQDSEWVETDWQTALETVVDNLKAIKAKNGADQIAGLMSPTATVEEGFLFQKWLRNLGTQHIDHRLRQQDFVDQGMQYSHAGWTLDDINDSDAIVLVGCNVRSEQPIIAHRIRQAAQSGALVSDINFFHSDLLMPVQQQLAVDGAGMVKTLAGIARALSALAQSPDEQWGELLTDSLPTALEQTIAMQLANAVSGTLFIGELADSHPQASVIRSLALHIAELTETRLVIMPNANSTGLSEVGVLPHRGPAADKLMPAGFNADQMWQQDLRAYVLFNVEPGMDCANPARAKQALQLASFVVAINSFMNDTIATHADVILPLAAFSETSGSFVGIDGQWQSFTGAVKARGDSRPGWKILRVLGNLCKHPGFDYVSSEDVLMAAKHFAETAPRSEIQPFIPKDIKLKKGLMLISEIAGYRSDSLVRRSEALQKTPEVKLLNVARLNTSEAKRHGVSKAENITIKQADIRLTMPLQLDDDIADGCLYLAAAMPHAVNMGNSFSFVEITDAGAGDV